MLLLTAVVAVRSVEGATATSGRRPLQRPRGRRHEPDPDIVETTIVADEATVDIGNGVTANAQTYNGAIPGPTFRLKVGDTVIVHYENDLAHPSGIHWHGIELSNAMDGTPFTQNQVPPGGTSSTSSRSRGRGSSGTTRTTTPRPTRSSRASTG